MISLGPEYIIDSWSSSIAFMGGGYILIYISIYLEADSAEKTH